MQERTRRTLGRMLDAAEKLVADRGFSDTSIAEIARVAGTSVGGFYRRFPDKQGLLQALHARFCDEARATADAGLDPARWVGTPIADIVRQFSAFLIQIYRERAGSVRAFSLAALTDDTVRQRTLELREHLHRCLAALLADRRAELGHVDVERSAAFAIDFMVGTLSQAVHFQIEAEPRLDGELPRLFLAYLGLRAD
ncbi:MAG TPA: TetR/AcrR family transcriptional regulator [Candidatus Dormibacteraeota bacterium]|nr:TetR/AcrR family transcriptional regulator [Candidatus Dormibacteraeota bacterium]